MVLFHRPVADDTDLERGPAHIRRQNIANAELLTEIATAHDSRRRAGFDGADSFFTGIVDAKHASVCLHHQRLPAQPL